MWGRRFTECEPVSQKSAKKKNNSSREYLKKEKELSTDINIVFHTKSKWPGPLYFWQALS